MNIKYHLAINLLLLLIASSISSRGLYVNNFGGKKDRTLIGKIYRLPEVREKESYLKKLTKGKGHISLIINERQRKGNPFYFIQVGYDNSLRFEVYFNFRIKKEDIEHGNIESCLYIMNDNSDFMPLLKWRSKTSKRI